jgi:hypothetical protein
MSKAICKTCGLPMMICCCEEIEVEKKKEHTGWYFAKKEREQQLHIKCEKVHKDGAEDFGFSWLGINQQILDLVNNEFPEIDTSQILNKTLLSRLAYWAMEKVKEKNTPPKIEIVEVEDDKK